MSFILLSNNVPEISHLVFVKDLYITGKIKCKHVFWSSWIKALY